MFSIRKGLSLPISGKPSQTVSRTVQPKTVAVIGYDYVGMKPTMLVGEGDVVKKANPYLKTKNVLVWFTRHLKPERSKQSTVVQNVSLNPSKLNVVVTIK